MLRYSLYIIDYLIQWQKHRKITNFFELKRKIKFFIKKENSFFSTMFFMVLDSNIFVKICAHRRLTSNKLPVFHLDIYSF